MKHSTLASCLLLMRDSGASVFQGATIKRDELTGEVLVARVIHGGLADRSGQSTFAALLHCLVVLVFSRWQVMWIV